MENTSWFLARSSESPIPAAIVYILRRNQEAMVIFTWSLHIDGWHSLSEKPPGMKRHQHGLREVSWRRREILQCWGKGNSAVVPYGFSHTNPVIWALPVLLSVWENPPNGDTQFESQGGPFESQIQVFVWTRACVFGRSCEGRFSRSITWPPA